uniref:Uncharacterized protein n=1 Tax=Arundo donax TaxID=35708 RepID=A0A0A9DHN4_ARUDO
MRLPAPQAQAMPPRPVAQRARPAQPGSWRECRRGGGNRRAATLRTTSGPATATGPAPTGGSATASRDGGGLGRGEQDGLGSFQTFLWSVSSISDFLSLCFSPRNLAGTDSGRRKMRQGHNGHFMSQSMAIRRKWHRREVNFQDGMEGK